MLESDWFMNVLRCAIKETHKVVQGRSHYMCISLFQMILVISGVFSAYNCKITKNYNDTNQANKHCKQ